VAIDINQILKVLPQKPPFLMIDRIVELTPGERAVAMVLFYYQHSYNWLHSY
jgi:3-hydroxyacyl-[acyl-carrier-protein] dehydratase